MNNIMHTAGFQKAATEARDAREANLPKNDVEAKKRALAIAQHQLDEAEKAAKEIEPEPVINSIEDLPAE